MAEFVVVGCGTVVPEGDRGASSFYFEEGDSRVLLDCGPGAVQALARLGLPWHSLTDLAITHFHADHIGALPGLFFAFKHGRREHRTRPLDVWGPAGVISLFERLCAAFGEFMVDPGFAVRIHEVSAGEVVELRSGSTLSAHKTPHTDESLAFRLDGPWGAFGYSGDTGPSDTLGPFMRGVDLLVCECSLRDHEVGDNHLSPTSVAGIAGAAEPDVLVLSHIYPHVRTTNDVAALVTRAGYAGEVRIAHEGLRVGF
jgi:ribonuclease BN (tRNA processing enzyme)